MDEQSVKRSPANTRSATSYFLVSVVPASVPLNYASIMSPNVPLIDFCPLARLFMAAGSAAEAMLEPSHYREQA